MYAKSNNIPLSKKCLQRVHTMKAKQSVLLFYLFTNFILIKSVES